MSTATVGPWEPAPFVAGDMQRLYLDDSGTAAMAGYSSAGDCCFMAVDRDWNVIAAEHAMPGGLAAAQRAADEALVARGEVLE